MDHDLEVFPDPAAVAARAADYVAGLARTAVAAGSRFSFAVSGGQTPWAMFRALAAADMPWASAELFQVDEGVAPAGDPDRNLTICGKASAPPRPRCTRCRWGKKTSPPRRAPTRRRFPQGSTS